MVLIKESESVYTPDTHPKEWEVFCQIDADKSGTLDTEELYAYVSHARR
jgi:hypothetical protein